MIGEIGEKTSALLGHMKEDEKWERGKLLLVCALAVTLSGCGTIVTKSNRAWGAPYSGAKCSAEGMESSVVVTAMGGVPAILALPFFAVDTVLSAVADTLVLPIDMNSRLPEYPGRICPFEFHLSAIPNSLSPIKGLAQNTASGRLK